VEEAKEARAERVEAVGRIGLVCFCLPNQSCISSQTSTYFLSKIFAFRVLAPLDVLVALSAPHGRYAGHMSLNQTAPLGACTALRIASKPQMICLRAHIAIVTFSFERCMPEHRRQIMCDNPVSGLIRPKNQGLNDTSLHTYVSIAWCSG
jgi:hypothetical protein